MTPLDEPEPEPEPEAEPEAAEPALELDDVHAGYGQFHALFGVSLRVDRGQALALVGHNGMGKTTVARVASGLVVPTAGRVLVGGRDLTGRAAHHFAQAGVAHAPEGRSVFATLTVEENLVLAFRRAFGSRGMRRPLERVYELFPPLAERRGQLAGLLSGGEQRMLTLARAMGLDPSVLIADELSLGLSPAVTDDVYGVLRDILATGTALLVIEQHTQHALALAGTAVVLERGTVAFAGPSSEVADRYAAFGPASPA